jgi:hypothetical protein
MAALGAGIVRTQLGDYRNAFWTAGILCVCAAFLLLGSRRKNTTSIDDSFADERPTAIATDSTV